MKTAIEIESIDYTGIRPEVFFRFLGIDMSAELDPGVTTPVVIHGSAVGAEVDIKFREYGKLQKAINRFVGLPRRA